MSHPIPHPTPIGTISSPGGQSLNVVAISHGALAWGDLPGGGQIRITATSDTAEFDAGAIIDAGLDASVDLALKTTTAPGCTPSQTMVQEFQDGKLVKQTIIQSCQEHRERPEWSPGPFVTLANPRGIPHS